MNRKLAYVYLAAVFLYGPFVTGCGSDEPRIVTGVATEYKLRDDAQKEYEAAMQKANN